MESEVILNRCKKRMNETGRNSSSNVCDINLDVLESYHLYTSVTCGIASLIGNTIVILTVYLNKSLHSTPNYVIVNMAASDMFVPSMNLLYNILLDQTHAGYLSQAVGSALCRFEYIFINFSFGVSMLSLVVITVHRFYAVAYPMRARLERLRTRVLLLLCTWLVPSAIFGPMVHFVTFEKSMNSCVSTMSEEQHLAHSVVNETVFTGGPLLVLLVLYPVIIVTLRRQKLLGNSTSSLIVRRRKQNIILTKMFITILLVLILTYLTNDVVHFVYEYWHVTDVSVQCTLFKLWAAVAPFPLIFHAVSPAIYFLFCSSYREGIKAVFFCCRRDHRNRRCLRFREEHFPLETVSQRS